MNSVRYLLFAATITLPLAASINGAAGAKRDASSAGTCGHQLQQGWSEGLMSHPAPNGAQMHLMMYTFSKAGSKRIDKRLAGSPELVENVAGLRTGPGGSLIFGTNRIQPWLNAPSQWFEKVCAIASEGRSEFVELGLYSSSNSDSPSFVVRAATGVGNNKGFWIGLEPSPLAPAPANSRNSQTH